jgi:hypothetical protein
MEGPTKEQIEESVRFTNWMEGVRKYTLAQVERRKQMNKNIHDKSLDENGINDGRRKIMDYQKIAREIVLNYVSEHLDKTDNVHIMLDDVFVVWFCKVLQNWKALVSTDLPDGMYYEVTYNGDKKEVYLDAYKKFDNREIDGSQT